MRCGRLKGRGFAFDAKIHRGSFTVAAALVLTAVAYNFPAQAAAWIPPAGTGEIEPMIRYSFADRSFQANGFSSTTHRSSKKTTMQLRLTGEHGLGHKLSLVYDFRYAFLHESKHKKGTPVVDTNKGFQDQLVGLDYGLTQRQTFADAVGLSIIAPGSSASTGLAVDSGQWASEPDYLVGFKPGFANLTANVAVGARTFFDGGVTQFRTHLELSAPATHRVRLVGTLFYVRSADMSSYNASRDRAERYNLLRLGIGAQFRATKGIEPILNCETDIVGRDSHADQRITIGVKVKY